MTIKAVHVPVHRLSYELWHGDIPEDLIIRHKCDEKKCVNPEHLEIGTHKDNTEDMISRGRNKILLGQDNPASKITDDEKEQIIRMGLSGELHDKIAKLFNISRTRVSSICRSNGMIKNPRKLTAEQKMEILTMRDNGHSRDVIASKLGISKSTVGYYVWLANKSKLA